MVQYPKPKYLLDQQKGESMAPGKSPEGEKPTSETTRVNYDPDQYEGGITAGNGRERPSTQQTLKAKKEREQKEALANPRKGQN